MKQKTFYTETMERTNPIKFFLQWLFPLTSLPRLSLEVFIRRNFGTDYFSLINSVLVIVINAIFPLLYAKADADFGTGDFFLRFTTWYLFLAAFGYKAWQRYLECRQKPGEFDFSKCSRYTGDINYRFYQLRIWGIEPTLFTISTLLEPSIFFGLGVVLALLGQPIGFVLIANSIIYSLSYVAAFESGRRYLQGKINNGIAMEELESVYNTGKYPRREKGFDFFDMPDSTQQRQRMASFMADKSEPLQAS